MAEHEPKSGELRHSDLRGQGPWHPGDGTTKFGPEGGIGKGTPHHDEGIKPIGKPVSAKQTSSTPIGRGTGPHPQHPLNNKTRERLGFRKY